MRGTKNEILQVHFSYENYIRRFLFTIFALSVVRTITACIKIRLVQVKLNYSMYPEMYAKRITDFY